MTKLNIKALKESETLLMAMNEMVFEVLKHSTIKIDENDVTTNAGTIDDSAIPFRDSLVISALIYNTLLLIIDKWDSFDSETKKFIEDNLHLITNYMKGK